MSMEQWWNDIWQGETESASRQIGTKTKQLRYLKFNNTASSFRTHLT